MLDIKYDKFVRQSSVIYGESIAYLVRNKKEQPSDELFKGLYAIASVHQINSKTYGVNSEPAKDFRSKGKSPREGLPLMRTATAAELKCTNGRN